MTPIQYVIGDATHPIGKGRKIIAHCCNDIGAWGAGFVLAISRRWREPEHQYREWFNKMGKVVTLPLGAVQFVEVERGLSVANIIGQTGLGGRSYGLPPIRYHALGAGLAEIAHKACCDCSSVHMPRMGAGLAGGDWEVIELLIQETLCASDVAVYVYDLPREAMAA
jgi:O-acetyl-ADP-ribose deacetylase (regulator of RNase III)